MAKGSLTVKVECSPGSSIDASCVDMCDLANRMEVTVEADFNGVKVIAFPNVDPKKLATAWRESLHRTHKMACVSPEF